MFFRVSLKLKEAGVSDKVIEAMMGGGETARKEEPKKELNQTAQSPTDNPFMSMMNRMTGQIWIEQGDKKVQLGYSQTEMALSGTSGFKRLFLPFSNTTVRLK